ncbi:glutamate receptor ionotropic, NMDA 2B-like [Oratosquilla oratoria]|uniref:glutamate receptor ionotropic, NMDA 2B-like n=1 Tax=Oratosquilla oratoria TaxID=337810 RepID=UPI003F76B691
MRLTTALSCLTKNSVFTMEGEVRLYLDSTRTRKRRRLWPLGVTAVFTVFMMVSWRPTEGTRHIGSITNSSHRHVQTAPSSNFSIFVTPPPSNSSSTNSSPSSRFLSLFPSLSHGQSARSSQLSLPYVADSASYPQRFPPSGSLSTPSPGPYRGSRRKGSIFSRPPSPTYPSGRRRGNSFPFSRPTAHPPYGRNYHEDRRGPIRGGGIVLSGGAGSSSGGSGGSSGSGGFGHVPVTGYLDPPAPERTRVTVGVVLPKSTFRQRFYEKEIKLTISEIRRNADLQLTEMYDFNYKDIIISNMQASSSPTKILDTLCERFLPRNISAILYLFNSESYGRSTASVQYFLQLAGYLGIPLIAWNADNSGLERDQRTSSFQLQMAPSIEHQVSAMLSILGRYSWSKFAIVTSLIAGHNDFVQALRDHILEMPEKPGGGPAFTVTKTILVNDPREDLAQLVSTDSRIFLLYSTRFEATSILREATLLGLTGSNYLWIVTQSVIQSDPDAPLDFPVGMLGVHFETNDDALIKEIGSALSVFAWGLQAYIKEAAGRNAVPILNPQLSCDTGDAKWKGGEAFYRMLKNVSIQLSSSEVGKPLEFNKDGTRKSVQLKIMNLRPDLSEKLSWEEIGTWHSWKERGLEVKDIVWPGYSHVPPNGIPEKFHLKVTFMEEPPFINMDPPHPKTGKCTANKGVPCRIASEAMMQNVNVSMAMKNSSYYQCCSGFCIDLLVKFSHDLGFSYDLFRVEDGIWGAIVNGKWTGLPGAIINGKADMVMTSIKINSQREEVLDFTVPFLDTGITIVVAKRTGIISPTAFLEPFDTASWMLVALVAIQVAAVAIFLFEWLSPSGYNMRMHPPRDHKFSLFRTLWMVWAILFQAAVNVDCPRGYTARFMGNVWAMFALIFLAIYTANLAAFMITREEFYDLSGVEDQRMQNPTSLKPAFRFGTTLHGNTDVVVKKSFPEMHTYMRQFNRSSPMQGFRAVKKGELDAFLYDATVLEYLVGQDDECKMLTVGSWYALTGYGVAFPRKSKYIEMFNERIMNYRRNGYLERLSRFWFTGACKPDMQKKSSSKPLALEQFMSTFLLLGCGILLALLLLGLEHVYYRYFKTYLDNTEHSDYCALLSMSMGRSTTFKRTVQDAQAAAAGRGGGRLEGSRCTDPLCDTQLWRVKHELDMARLRIQHLEKQLEDNGLRPPTKRDEPAQQGGTSSSSTSLTAALRRDRQTPPPSILEEESELGATAVQESDGESQCQGAVAAIPRRYEYIKHRDMTRNHVSTNEPIRGPLVSSRHHHPRREVAELETVL